MKPLCPRCGYDLSGAVGSWVDRCPLEGTCAECGLKLGWSRVLILSEHPWLFEYNWRRKPLQRLIRTWLEALRPRRFWQTLQLTDPIHLRPLGLVITALFAAMLVGGLFMVLALSPKPWWSRPDFLAYGVRTVVAGIGIAAPGLFAAFLVMPLVFAVMPQTLGKARVRPAHIVRIWLYSLLLPLTVLVLWAGVVVGMAAAGFKDVAFMLIPWEWTSRVSIWRFPMLHTFVDALPGLGLAMLYTAWAGYWSWCGCTHYLRLETAGRVTLALVAIVFLVVLYVQVLAWNAFAW